MTDNPGCPSVSVDFILADCLCTSVARVLGILQFVGQEPHHAGGIWVRSVDIIEVVRSMNGSEHDDGKVKPLTDTLKRMKHPAGIRTT